MVEEKKIDEEWKRRAREEKILEQQKIQAEAARKEFPPVNFSNFITGLGAQALIALGQVENPVTKECEVDLEQAKYLIDTLQMLQKKTQGNLTPEEAETLQQLIFNLQLAYIKVAP